MIDEDPALIGTWKSDPGDVAGTGVYGNVTLRFDADGTLLHTVHELDRDQVIRLTYRVELGVIITDQPSRPGPERTPYEFAEDGALVLAFGGQKSRYLKVK